jgi:DNA-binding CsgD family transcriptional regulator
MTRDEEDHMTDVCSLRGEERRILDRRRPARRQWRAGHDNGAVTLDENGFVVDMNAAAQAILDDNIKIRDRRIILRDAKSRGRLKEAIDSLRVTPRLNPLIADPIIVPRVDKLPVVLRIKPCSGETQAAAGGPRFVMTLNALDSRLGPAAPTIAKIFGLTPSEAKLASIIARGAPPAVAARELKISRETARNQLKSVFAKTDTHRQSALVALLLQVE